MGKFFAALNQRDIHRVAVYAVAAMKLP